jgi:hypothetical protein
VDNPVRDLLADYQTRRERIVKATAGPYQDDRSAILGAADGLLARVEKARGTLLAVQADERAGRVSTEQAGKLKQAVLDDVRNNLDRTTGATKKVLGVLPDRLLGDAFPLHQDRTPATAEAKADLDRELGSIQPTDLPSTIAATARRRYAEGDSLGADLLLGAHGRDRLASAGVPDAEKVHAELRRSFAREAGGTLPYGRKHAAATLAQVDEWHKAFIVAANAADMALGDLEAGRFDGDE